MESDLNRYASHIKLGSFGVLGQEALSKAKVLIIGAGPISLPVLSYLTSMGIGKLGLISNELISGADLALQTIFKANDVGKSSAKSISNYLKDLNPELKLDVFEQELSSSTIISIVQGFDLVVDATNDFNTAFLINDACVISKIPMVYGAVHKYEAYLGVFNYKGSATFRCLAMDTKNDLSFKQGAAEGMLGVLPGITGCLLANEVVKIISGLGDVLSNKLLVFDSLKMGQKIIPIEAMPANFQITSMRDDYSIKEPDYFEAHPQAMNTHQLLLKLAYQESLQLIDLRESPAQIDLPIENILYLPNGALLNYIDKISQDIPVVLISDDENESKKLSFLLNEHHGFGNVYYLTGGLAGLTKEQYMKQKASVKTGARFSESL